MGALPHPRGSARGPCPTPRGPASPRGALHGALHGGPVPPRGALPHPEGPYMGLCTGALPGGSAPPGGAL